jgi:Uma2 family endonuclease
MKLLKSRATYEDLMQAPHNVIAEIIDGELYGSPRPGIGHMRVSSMVVRDLGDFDHEPGDPDAPPEGWWILIEPELHLASDVLVPDVAGWRRDRLPRLPNVVGMTQPPDWVCEVLSPSTSRIDRTRKMAIYARESVGHLWLIDPAARMLEVYRLQGDRWLVASTHGGDDRVRAAPFDAVEIALPRWWLDSVPMR